MESSEKTEAKADRVAGVDIAKGLGICVMILGHTYFTHGWTVPYRLAYPFHMVLFFICAGLFLNTERPYREFVLGKVKRLLLPYLLFGVIGVTLVAVVASSARGADSFSTYLLKGLGAFLYGSTAPLKDSLVGPVRAIGALWFLPALFISLCIARALQKWRYGILIAALLSVLALTYHELGGVWLPFSFLSACFGALLVMIGKLFAVRTEMLSRPMRSLVWLGLIVYGVCVAFNWTVSLGALRMSNLAMLVLPLLIVYAVIGLSRYLAGIPGISGFLGRTGRQSMSVYCFHYLFLSGGIGPMLMQVLGHPTPLTARWWMYVMVEFAFPFVPLLWMCFRREESPES